MPKKDRNIPKNLQPGAEKLAKRARQLLTSPDVPSYYANSVEVAFSPNDFRIRLGEVLDADTEKIAIKHLATVYFSPKHAKEVLALFQGKMREYEEKHGKIPI